MTAVAQSQQSPPVPGTAREEAMLERVLEALLSADALTPQAVERGGSR